MNFEIFFYIELWIITLLLAVVSVIFFRLQRVIRKQNNQIKTNHIKFQIEFQDKIFKQFSHNIHDHVGQLLSITKLQLQNLNKNENTTKYNELCQLVDTSLNELKIICKGYEPDYFIKLGLLNAIQFQIDLLQKSLNCVIKFDKNIEFIPIYSNIFIHIYHIIQEIFTNTIKHSFATIITVGVFVKKQILYLSIEDNGKGFDMNQLKYEPNGLGLIHIQERIKLIKGKLSIKSTLNIGTKTTIELSLKR